VGTCAFPTAAAAGLRRRGITPIIWWQPAEPGNESAGHYGRYRLIIEGRHDQYIREWALAAKRFGKPVVVRLAHEMNGDWFEWSVNKHDNNPRLFRQAWQHVVKQFRQVGARNVKFLWSPHHSRAYERLYPGNAYVDYVGVTILNYGKKNWRSMDQLLQRWMASLRALTRSRAQRQGKPVIIPELASNHVGGNKAAWIKKGYPSVYRKWPVIKAVVYFDYDTRFVGQPDWRLAKPANGSALHAYRSIAGQKRFRASFR
jgi:beta-mannanase